jgi:hypothetical protein
VTSFAKMMTKRTGEHELASWLNRAEANDQPELHTFAAGIRQDLAAVTAGLTLPTASVPPKATSTRSNRSNDRCTAAQASTSCANASSITLHDPATKSAPEPITLAGDTGSAKSLSGPS